MSISVPAFLKPSFYSDRNDRIAIGVIAGILLLFGAAFGLNALIAGGGSTPAQAAVAAPDASAMSLLNRIAKASKGLADNQVDMANLDKETIAKLNKLLGRVPSPELIAEGNKLVDELEAALAKATTAKKELLDAAKQSIGPVSSSQPLPESNLAANEYIFVPLDGGKDEYTFVPLDGNDEYTFVPVMSAEWPAKQGAKIVLADYRQPYQARSTAPVTKWVPNKALGSLPTGVAKWKCDSSFNPVPESTPLGPNVGYCTGSMPEQVVVPSPVAANGTCQKPPAGTKEYPCWPNQCMAPEGAPGSGICKVKSK